MPRDNDKRSISDHTKGGHHPAEIVYSALFLAFAVFLLSRIGSQTTWVGGAALVQQPAFWPAVAIGGMTLCGAVELWSAWRRSARGGGTIIAGEVFDWLRALEYVVWFMAYVWLVPITGYLPTTLAFCAALTWRLGYRTWRFLMAAVLVGAGTVIIFKSFLAVRIPAGAVYDYLPREIGNFMGQYL